MNEIGLVAGSDPPNWKCTGVIFQESEVKLNHILDGASKTYLLGERYVHKLNYLRDIPVPDGGGTVIHGGDNWGWGHWF